MVRCVGFLWVLLWAWGWGTTAAGAQARSGFEAPAVVREKISALRTEIARHEALYHRQAAPEISDADDDRLKRQLRDWETRYPEMAREVAAVAEIGDDRSGLFKTYPHRERMMSLDKVYTEAELRMFGARVEKLAGRAGLAWLVEPKFDGLAVSVTFEQGRLGRAVTRGNGIEGDEVTAHVRAIAGLPRVLRGRRAARGLEGSRR